MSLPRPPTRGDSEAGGHPQNEPGGDAAPSTEALVAPQQARAGHLPTDACRTYVCPGLSEYGFMVTVRAVIPTEKEGLRDTVSSGREVRGSDCGRERLPERQVRVCRTALCPALTGGDHPAGGAARTPVWGGDTPVRGEVARGRTAQHHGTPPRAVWDVAPRRRGEEVRCAGDLGGATALALQVTAPVGGTAVRTPPPQPAHGGARPAGLRRGPQRDKHGGRRPDPKHPRQRRRRRAARGRCPRPRAHVPDVV